MRRFDDTHQPPPAGRLRGRESLFRRDEPRTIDDPGVQALLLRPPRERIGRALDLKTGQLAIHGRHVDADVSLAQPELVEDDRVGLVPLGKVSLEQRPDVPVLRRIGTHPRGKRYGRQRRHSIGVSAEPRWCVRCLFRLTRPRVAETRYARLLACGTHYALTSAIPFAVCDGLRLSH